MHSRGALVAGGVAVVHPGVAPAPSTAAAATGDAGVDVHIVNVVVVVVVVPREVVGADQVDVAAVAAGAGARIVVGAVLTLGAEPSVLINY